MSSGQPSGSYRLKFRKEEFLSLIAEAQPKRLYRVNNVHYFSYDGFIMYCDENIDAAIAGRKVFNAIEFSNMQWRKV